MDPQYSSASQREDLCGHSGRRNTDRSTWELSTVGARLRWQVEPSQLLSGPMQAEKEAGTMSKSLSSDSKSLIVPLQPRAALRTAGADEGSQQQACLAAPRGGCEQTQAMWLSAWPWRYLSHSHQVSNGL